MMIIQTVDWLVVQYLLEKISSASNSREKQFTQDVRVDAAENIASVWNRFYHLFHWVINLIISNCFMGSVNASIQHKNYSNFLLVSDSENFLRDFREIGEHLKEFITQFLLRETLEIQDYEQVFKSINFSYWNFRFQCPKPRTFSIDHSTNPHYNEAKINF